MLLEAARNGISKDCRANSTATFGFFTSPPTSVRLLGPEACSREARPTIHRPYSASKAASDHLVRAWHRTFGLPIGMTNCSNNYGPLQFPEKLIPLMILNPLERQAPAGLRPGLNVRDWLYVEDHVRGHLDLIFGRGPDRRKTYNVGGLQRAAQSRAWSSALRDLDRSI